MHFWIVEGNLGVQNPNDSSIILTYYQIGVGIDCSITIENRAVLDFAVVAEGSCVGNAYAACQANCGGSCQTSCAFWNDWFGGLCNKAMWIGAAATCAGLPAPGGACGGFN